MNNWTVEQIAFRCDTYGVREASRRERSYRLSVRLERLAQNFLQMASLSLDGVNGEAVINCDR
ncbi:hypothetical protein H6G54_25250 [Anabaena cylindrica FACHB-243]|uniref:Uncharacterized protein n=1 Tax=Anabaena cylindrica (strain ATCC 27899 / PCC 7122) TaxID=272123 RepID=K9ZEW1_ANACC|nr:MULTISPECIES: hypothetical protein [Anabaena]AFZ57274.1 hypothetical protein Anacy_1784 [Anabaena cylindrica PCC 7122]MBD2420944.1 hypothetical protein [Anabaena cylindrica FACHB-243]MBY5283456.1 hypothetical protein [Anabaena sp. CCAP 1446/1C]MBY5307019.1 hypothetical protein [Anabaena sp. CCAP 1446/1C]MCM2405697.1 hypothetical protein [Anabaena sp. CCAP 1446/1C]